MALIPDVLPDALPDVVRRVLNWVRIDFRPTHRQPAWWRVGLATVVALAGSLLADAALVAIGKRVYPATNDFVHFQIHDYAKLTVIGVIIACAAWPIVTRVSSAPRWLFFRSAIAVTLVLFLPDLYIWVKGESGQGVLFLLFMHVAIALVTYNALVHVAPVGSPMEAPSAPSARLARHARSG